MGTNAEAHIGYNGTLEDLEKLVNTSTEFEKRFHIIKRFQCPKGYTLQEAFDRRLKGEDDAGDFHIQIDLRTPDQKQSAFNFVVWVNPKILTLWSVKRAFDFEDDTKMDLYVGSRDGWKRYPKREMGFRYLMRKVALSIAGILNQNVVIYGKDQGGLADDIDDKINDGITMFDLITYLKEKHAFESLSHMWGFGGVEKVFYEMVDSS